MKRVIIGSLTLCSLIVMLGAGDGYNRGYHHGYAVSGGSSAPATWDTLTIVFTTNPSPGSYYPEHDADIAAADIVVDLDTVSTFAFAEVDSAKPAGIYSSRFHHIESPSRQIIDGVAQLDQRLGVGGYSSRTMSLMHIPFEDYIPANSQIVSAVMNAYNYTTSYFSKGDTVMATMMNTPADSAWYRNKGISISPNYAFTTWNQQRATSVEGNATTAGDVKYWSPPLSARGYYYDMGDSTGWVGDWTGSTNSSTGVVAGSGVHIGLTNCVQGVVNGKVNNGIALFYSERSTSAHNLGIFHWDEDGGSLNKSPWITVKYITRKYRAPFSGNNDLAFLFATYDGVKDANDSMKVVFDNHGGDFTIYPAQIHIDSNDIRANGHRARNSYAELVAYNDDGIEIGSHSRYHNGPSNGRTTGAQRFNGVTFWEAASDSIDAADGAGAWRDSLAWDMSPNWLIAGALAETGRDMSSVSNFAKSFGCPSGEHGPNVLLETFGSLDLGYSGQGYTAFRSQAVSNPVSTGYYDYFDPPNLRPADADSSWAGLHLLADPNHPGLINQRAPIDLRMMAMSFEIATVTGDTNEYYSKVAVQHNMRRLLIQAKGDGSRVLSTDIHDLKTFTLTGDYDDRLDPIEMDWMLDVMDEYNVWYTTDTAYVKYMISNSTAVATPLSFAQPDSFKYNAADKIWYLPDGIDGTFIPGLK